MDMEAVAADRGGYDWGDSKDQDQLDTDQRLHEGKGATADFIFYF